MDLEKLINKNKLYNKYFSLLVQRFCGKLAMTMPPTKRKFWLKSLLLKLHLHTYTFVILTIVNLITARKISIGNWRN